LTWFHSIASIACYLGMCVLICVILLVCVNAIAFLNFRPKCGAIIQPKSGQTKLWPDKCMAQYRWNLVENVSFETRRVSLVYRHAHRPCLAQKCHVWDTPCIAGVSSRSLSLMSRPKMSRLRHAVYRWCIVTLIIAHVSPNVSLENVTFETCRVSLCMITSRSLSLMSRSISWPEYRSCHAMIFGTGYYMPTCTFDPPIVYVWNVNKHEKKFGFCGCLQIVVTVLMREMVFDNFQRVSESLEWFEVIFQCFWIFEIFPVVLPLLSLRVLCGQLCISPKFCN
jgi:hypothetical protein